MKVRVRSSVGIHFHPPAITRRRGRAFTLIELLVVIAILALLVVMMVPTLGAVFGTAKSKLCGNNLKRIAEGVRLHDANDDTEMIAMSWQEMIRPYIGGDTRCLSCPEFPEAEQDVVKPVPLSELVQFRVNGVYFEDLDKGPFVVKLSDTQYRKAKADGWINDAGSANHFPRAQYEDGSEDNANPYWLCLEDHGGDQDFKDIQAKVTVKGGGYHLEMEAGYTGHNNWLVNKSDRSEIVRVPSHATGIKEFIPTSGMITSYGMNSEATDLLNKPGKVLVMDFVYLVAFPTDIWSDHHPDNGHLPIFARHRDHMNVLFTDGGVRLMDPNAVDPCNPTVENTYWLP